MGKLDLAFVYIQMELSAMKNILVGMIFKLEQLGFHLFWWSTVECHDNAVQYYKILHTLLQWWGRI